MSFPAGTSGKESNTPANPRDARDVSLIPRSRRSSEGGNGNPLQYSCLENSMDRPAWQATVHGGHEESDMTERLSAHTQIH